MKILVTGGAGFIGSHLVQHFQGRAQVRVLDNFVTGFRRNLDGLDCELVEGSIEDEEGVAQAMQGVDYVFHLAAMVSVPHSMQHPLECVRTNTLGTLNVLKAAACHGVRKLVFASSAAVYGNNPDTPKREAMAPEPCSPYAVTKLDGEYYCGMFSSENQLPTACLRFFNVFGPRQSPDGAYAAAVPIFVHRALRGEPLVIYGDGGQTRDFIGVKDVVSALEFVALREEITGVFNCGYGRALSLNDLAARIVGLAQSASPIVHEAPRPGDIRHSIASVEKLAAAGWTPSGTVESGLEEMVQSLRG